MEALAVATEAVIVVVTPVGTQAAMAVGTITEIALQMNPAIIRVS